MVEISYKSHGLTIVDVWFPGDDEIGFRGDILHIYGTSHHSESEIAKKKTSLITDLTCDEADLLAQIKNKNIRYEIRRSEKDELQITYYNSSDILNHSEILRAFKSCYDQMFIDKGMKTKLNLEAISRYAECRALLLTVVLYQGEPIVFHSYVVDGEHARFYHSCSTFREDKAQAQLVGRANKRLHWEDWLYLKKQGYTTYDWGGLFPTDESNGINAFKLAFGGSLVEYYNVEIPLTIAGKVATKVKMYINR